MRGRWTGFAVGLGTLVSARQAAAQEHESPQAQAPGLPVSFSADAVGLDARGQALQASGDVRVAEPPFFLTSDALRLRRVPIGVELEGEGQVGFCPCLGTPLAVRFRGATVAPPHDLIVRDPVLEVFGVPLAWAPVFWFRSPGRVGVLPPEVAWRGADGVFAGEGVHVPWRQGDVAHGLDLRAGGYFRGGLAVETSLRTVESETRARWDWLRGSGGLDLFARGATAIRTSSGDGVAWELDALRGARAVQSTTNLEVAAFPFDLGAAQAVWRADGWWFASGVRAVSLRGSELLDAISAGPVITARNGDAIGSFGAYDLTLEGGAVSTSGLGTTSFARSEASASLAGRLGPMVAAASARAYGDVADDGRRDGLDGAGELRTTLALPLVRAYDSGEANDHWIHRTEPGLEAAAIALHESDVFVVPAARGMQTAEGGAWVATGTWSNGFGRWGSHGAAALDVAAGAVGDARQTALALRARATVDADWLGLRADVGRVFSPSSAEGGASVARARIGPAAGLHLSGHVAERDGVDPLLARALVDAPLEPATGFLSLAGLTGGAALAIPWGSRVTTRAGADADLTARDLVAEVASLELHDPCGCVVVRATASHRIGRAGVDAWVTIDLPALP